MIFDNRLYRRFWMARAAGRRTLKVWHFGGGENVPTPRTDRYLLLRAVQAAQKAVIQPLALPPCHLNILTGATYSPESPPEPDSIAIIRADPLRCRFF